VDTTSGGRRSAIEPEMDHHASIDSLGYDISQFMPQQPPQIFGGYNSDGTPLPATLSAGAYFGDLNDGSIDENDPKRRRIARVRSYHTVMRKTIPSLTNSVGLRHVQEEKDQVRWEDAQMWPLHQLQNRMYIHAG
jgi:hypothetical protein